MVAFKVILFIGVSALCVILSIGLVKDIIAKVKDKKNTKKGE